MSEPRIGDFRLERELGRGGMGVVWAARSSSDEVVALKFVTMTRRLDALRTAFLSEVAAMARLDHPNICVLKGFGRVSPVAASLAGLAEGTPYLAMDLVSGPSLRAEVGQVDWPRLRTIARQTLKALAHAHARGVIHLDVKPGNLLACARRGVMLCDFGIARLLEDPGETTNLAGERPDVVAELKALLDRCVAEGRSVPAGRGG